MATQHPRHLKTHAPDALDAEISEQVTFAARELRRAARDRDVDGLRASVITLKLLRDKVAQLARPAADPVQSKHAHLMRLATLPKICNLIAAQIKPKRIPLYEHPRRTDPRQATLWAISNRLVASFEAQANPHGQSDTATEAACYSDIRLPQDEFITHIHAAYRLCLAQRRNDLLRFIDIGCGGGGKVLTARAVFDQTCGLELDPDYASAARDLLDSKDAVIEGNALTFPDYAAFDVIYMYQPIRDDTRLIELEANIAREAKPGTILIAPYDHYRNRHDDYGVAHIAGRIYVTQTSRYQATRLKAEAEKTGLLIRRPGSTSPQLKLWEPVLQASWANGFDMG